MSEEKEYWSLDELVAMTDEVQKGEIDYKGKTVEFQWCELAEAEEPKVVMVDDDLSEDEKSEKYMEMGRERATLMLKKADEKNPDGPSLVDVWSKLPSTLKYQITNIMMGIENPNLQQP
jgi:pyruvate/2-oxoacid:ferredoxin oxidoreductase beta subunit|tara:strand:+ start:40 stop:396 length:357 start_codon:yes stop_codon:yes gene_type:complete